MTEAFLSLDQLIGHSRVKRHLQRIAARQTVPHALLFSGPEGVGKRLCAEAFGRLLVETAKESHPDLHLFRPEGKTGMHSLERLRSFGREVYLAPFEAKKKVFILDEADRMLPTSANALLKTFEEPPRSCVIILVSSRPEKLLSTILSRCQKVPFFSLKQEEIVSYLKTQFGMATEEAKRYFFWAKGSLGKIVQRVARKDEREEEALEVLLLKGLAEGALTSYGRLLALSEKLAAILEKRLKEEEKTLFETFLGEQAEHMTALQKEALQKEVEGILSVRKIGEVKELFEGVQGWFRDMHLLRVGGVSSLLMHPDYEEALLREVEKEQKFLSLEEVGEAVSMALLSLERSTSLKICFEQLFMRCQI